MWSGQFWANCSPVFNFGIIIIIIIMWGQMAGTCEYGDEISGSIKCGEFLD